jgi:REP-associated tyrosine transposase
MPRQPRLDAPGALHHVIGRGINGVKIFDSRKDREDFIERLAGLCGADALSVYSWAFLSNHFLGINTSAVNRLAVSDELSEVEKYI